MPSSLVQTLERELAVRGGVTLGLGPFLRASYGESDLRGELTARLRAALAEEDFGGVERCLMLDASAGGILPRRELANLRATDEVAPWLVRAVGTRPDADAMLESIASRDDACATLTRLVSRRSAGMVSAGSEQDQIAFAAPVTEIFVPPRKTEQAVPRTARKVGRNDPCVCGSGRKYKKCCINKPGGGSEPREADDAPGLPGITTAESFWFRGAGEELGKLCRRRLQEGGPRAGETLFWPIEAAPVDELTARAEMATQDRHHADLVRVLTRAWQLEAFVPETYRDYLARLMPVESWADDPPTELYALLPEELAAVVPVAGAVSATRVLELSQRPERARDITRNSLIAAHGGDFGPVIDAAQALAQAGEWLLALLLIRFVRGTTRTLEAGLTTTLKGLEGLLAPRFDQRPLTAEEHWSGAESQADEIRGLRGQLAQLEREHARVSDAWVAETHLRKRLESEWSREGEDATTLENLRNEVRRLKAQLKGEHDARRTVEKRLQTFRTRERIRLLRESELEDTKVAELEQSLLEPGEEVADIQAAPQRYVSYQPDFETVAQRLPPSTVERLRTQIEALAQGNWVREAKRMEGCDGLWTLRAGIHYRALIRQHADHLEVFDLIAREELPNALARLRS